MDSVISLAGVSGSSGPHGDSDSQCDVEIDAADNADHLEFSPENIEDSLFFEESCSVLYLSYRQSYCFRPPPFRQSLKICSQYMISASLSYFLN